jgi:hypothetical protein
LVQGTPVTEAHFFVNLVKFVDSPHVLGLTKNSRFVKSVNFVKEGAIETVGLMPKARFGRLIVAVSDSTR